MKLQYAKFASLVLPFYGMGRIPSYPFDVSNGVSTDELHNIFYHYHPTISIVQFPNIGYAIPHFADNDSRWVCCLSCDDVTYGETPDLLTDAVEMGMAAWGGKLMIPEDALRLSRYLQPSRQFVVNRLIGDTEHQVRLTIPAITLDANGVLTRGATTEEIIS